MKEHQQELYTNLWAIANDLRGNMEANEFKNYILGLIFFRYLSEKVESRANQLLEEDNISYAEAWEDDEIQEDLQEELTIQLGFYIEPKNLFGALIDKIKIGKFDVELLERAINQISTSTQGQESEKEFDHLFDDMDLKSTKLGRDVKSRSTLIGKVMNSIADLSFSTDDTEIDILGDAYEYLIGQFASNAGKKAG